MRGKDNAAVTRDLLGANGMPILGQALLKLKFRLFRRKVIDAGTFHVGIELVISDGRVNLFLAVGP